MLDALPTEFTPDVLKCETLLVPVLYKIFKPDPIHTLGESHLTI